MQAGGELVHVISFLLQMGFREVGVPFPLEGLNPLQANIAAQLSQLGLLMPFRCPFLLPHALQVPLHSASCPSSAPLPAWSLFVGSSGRLYNSMCNHCLSVYLYPYSLPKAPGFGQVLLMGQKEKR